MPTMFCQLCYAAMSTIPQKVISLPHPRMFHGILLYSNNKLKALEMASQGVSQELFIRVKERLDYYRLPPTFSIQDTVLLAKLLALVDGKTPAQPTASLLQGDSLSAALKHEIARVVKENNQLHMDLVVAKENIQSLEHGLFKMGSNRHSEGQQLQRYTEMRSNREQEMVDELRDVKYKYNELMDFLHEDPRADRQYIKRLMKHKQVNVQEGRKEGQAGRREGQAGELGQAGRQLGKTEGDFRMKELEHKVRNREKEILRLQKCIEYDGVNMNKLIKNFNDDMAKKQLRNADSKINYLEESYDQVKKENTNMKNKRGLREALRTEVDKCHRIIDELKHSNQELRRNHQEDGFDGQQKTAENDRKIGKVKSEKVHGDRLILQNQAVIRDLHKKIEFLEKSQGLEKQALVELEGVVQEREADNDKLAKRNEETKVFYEYELQNLKSKINELELENEDHREKGRQILAELDMVSEENELKSQSIANLEKIVNELIRKNSLLADHTAGTLEHSLKQSAELEFKNKLLNLERTVVILQEERAQLEASQRAMEQRLSQVAKENERFKYENGTLRDDLSAKETAIGRTTHELEQVRLGLRKEHAENVRTVEQIRELTRNRDTLVADMKSENERLTQQERALKLRIKDMEIKTSEEEGVWEVTRERLDEKEAKIKQLERLLTDSVEQSKSLADQNNQLDHRNHELDRENHRFAKKYEELKRDETEFKSTSFKNYEASINDSFAELNELKKEILRLSEAKQTLSMRLEEMSGRLGASVRENEESELEKLSLSQELEMVKSRLQEMQEIERALVVENEGLRKIARNSP